MFFFGPCMVPDSFRVSNKLERGTYASFAGKKEGMWNAIMSLFGMGASFAVDVTDTAVQLEESKFGVRVLSSVAIKNVAGTVYGFARNPAYLAVAIMCFIGGVSGAAGLARAGGAAAMLPLLGGLLFGSLFLLGYFMSKRLGFAVGSAGGLWLRLRIKPGRAGRRTVGLDEIADVVDLINALCSGKPLAAKSDYEDDDDDER